MAEARLVQTRAARFEPSIIRLGAIVFFSTASGDAWMLDAKDGEVACLAREGVAEPIPIQESATKFWIAWNAHYRIENNLFLVIAKDGTASVIQGYPIDEIQQYIDDPAFEHGRARFDMDSIHKRVHETGRNDPCPCGSGKKYKKCCQAADEKLMREATARRGAESLRRGELKLAPPKREYENFSEDEEVVDLESADESGEVRLDAAELEPSHDDDAAALSPEVEKAADQVWADFEDVANPSTERINAFVDALLALPPEATKWNEAFPILADKEHADLPGIFRRIASSVPPTKATAMGFFYGSAIEEFVRSRRADLIPEIVTGFCTLNRESYDPDALDYVENWAIALGCEAEALRLAEHFLPILRSDDDLMPNVVPETCDYIFQLRVGMRLRDWGTPGLDASALAGELHQYFGDDIYHDCTDNAARVICGGGTTAGLTRDVFDLGPNDARETDEAWQQSLGRQRALMHVAHEGWETDRRPPGCALLGLRLLLLAANEGTGKNLLDCLNPTGMERRIVSPARSLTGMNVPLAHILIEAHADLLRFAVRHGLIDSSLSRQSEMKLGELRQELAFLGGTK